MTVLLRSEDTSEGLEVIEGRMPAGGEGPSPGGRAWREAYYVIDGELAFRVGGEERRVGSGGFAFMPEAVAHPSDAPARYLLVRTPAGGGPGLKLKVVPDVPGKVKVLLRGPDSGGALAVVDNVVPAGAKGPPLHHHDFDEAFYILAGEATFRLGDELVTRHAGELVFAPRGAHHAFANQSGADIRWLLICAPAGFERYFQRMAAKQAGVDPPPEALEPWPEVTVVGPRIGSDPEGV
jgi:mannose-6-phosphate isomerase-like protein (cupin superfamily)